MSDHHTYNEPSNSAKLLLPVAVLGLLLLMSIMYFGGISNGFFIR